MKHTMAPGESASASNCPSASFISADSIYDLAFLSTLAGSSIIFQVFSIAILTSTPSDLTRIAMMPLVFDDCHDIVF